MGKAIETKEYAKFIEKLRKARLEAGLRQIEVAKKVKRPPNLIFQELNQENIDLIFWKLRSLRRFIKRVLNIS